MAKNNTEDAPPALPKIKKKAYEIELARLQTELVTMQQWVKASGTRVVAIFEGRDAAGKGSAIKRFTEVLNPRLAKIVALPAPTERQRTQWYFQRYVEHLPAAGEIVFMDRSWYNRAGVERVMGFCTPDEYRRFLHQAPIFERLLVEDGIMLFKYWFSVSDVEQERRFQSRLTDPNRRWKLSPMDVQSISRWEDYSRAKDEMFVHTDIPEAPWYTVESEDKKRSRINVISHLLSNVPYERIEPEPVTIPKRPKATTLCPAAARGVQVRARPRGNAGQVEAVGRIDRCRPASQLAGRHRRFLGPTPSDGHGRKDFRDRRAAAGTLRGHPPGRQHVVLRGRTEREPDVLFDQQHRHPAPRREIQDGLLDLGHHGRLDALGRLVQDQQLRLGDQRPGDRELLTLPAGQQTRLAAQQGLQRREHLQRLADQLLAAACGRRPPAAGSQLVVSCPNDCCPCGT